MTQESVGFEGRRDRHDVTPNGLIAGEDIRAGAVLGADPATGHLVMVGRIEAASRDVNEGPVEFAPDDLTLLRHLAEKIDGDATWAGRRLVVEVWDLGDNGPVAWIERHPDDSEATITFGARSGA